MGHHENSHSSCASHDGHMRIGWRKQKFSSWHPENNAVRVGYEALSASYFISLPKYWQFHASIVFKIMTSSNLANFATDSNFISINKFSIINYLYKPNQVPALNFFTNIMARNFMFSLSLK